MLEKLIAFFKGKKFGLLSFAMQEMAPLLEHLEQNYKNDGEAKNALIDTLIQVLQQHKDVPNESK